MGEIKIKNLLKSNCVKITALSLVLAIICSFVPNALAMQENNEAKIPTGYWTDPGNYNVDWYDKNRDAKEFTISTPAELAGLSAIVNGSSSTNKYAYNFKGKTVNLAGDLDMKDHYWTPIGNNQDSKATSDLFRSYFSGTFNGNKHTISNLCTTDSSKNFRGLFGIVSDGKIQKVGLIDSNIVGNLYIGGLVGCLSGTSIIQSCYNTGNVKGCENVGGICGAVWCGNILSCYNIGQVEGTSCVGGVCGVIKNSPLSKIQCCYNTNHVKGQKYVGGVVGDLSSGRILSCYNTGQVEGLNQVGGVAGGVNKACISILIQYCYNTGQVKGDSNAGGVAGCLTLTNVKFCFNTGDVTGKNKVGGVAGTLNLKLQSCYNVGKVKGEDQVGGVVGINLGNMKMNINNIENCYYCNNKGKLSNNVNNLGVPKLSSEMKQPEFINLIGEKFINPQEIGLQNENKDFPVIKSFYEIEILKHYRKVLKNYACKLIEYKKISKEKTKIKLQSLGNIK